MSISDILVKIADGVPLTPTERIELKTESQHISDAASLLNSILKPGTQTIRIDNLEASNVTVDNGDIVIDGNAISVNVGSGLIVIDNDGITLDNNVGVIRFKNAAGEVKMGIFAFSNDALIISQDEPEKEIVIRATATNGNPIDVHVRNDPSADDVGQLNLGLGDDGSKITISGTIALFGQGDFGGSSYVLLAGTTVTPPVPASADPGGPSGHLYVKGGKLICQYNDSGTTRYKYLDLAGTGVTWVHTTTAP